MDLIMKEQEQTFRESTVNEIVAVPEGYFFLHLLTSY